MRIRLSTLQDLSDIMTIYDYAREFMRAHDNPRQWAIRNWPPESLIIEDIASQHNYVCVDDNDQIIGTFYYNYGQQIESDYLEIENGQWIGEDTYGVVHRIAANGSQKGIGTFCLTWAYEQCHHIRIDTRSRPQQLPT